MPCLTAIINTQMRNLHAAVYLRSIQISEFIICDMERLKSKIVLIRGMAVSDKF